MTDYVVTIDVDYKVDNPTTTRVIWSAIYEAMYAAGFQWQDRTLMSSFDNEQQVVETLKAVFEHIADEHSLDDLKRFVKTVNVVKKSNVHYIKDCVL